jgi:hypothetical protein
MWPLKTILYFVLFWAGCALSIVNPIWGVLNYIMVYQMNPTKTWWGKPLMSFGIRFSLVAMLFLLLGVAVARRKIPAIPRGFSLWEGGAALLVIVAGITRILGIGYDPNSVYAFEKLWKMLLFAVILGRVAATRENMRLVIWSIVLGSMYLGYDAYTANPDDFVHGRLEEIGGADFSTTSGAAAHTVAMLPLIGSAFLMSHTWLARLTATVTGGLAFNTFILCRTRSAFVGLAVGILAAFLLAPRVRRYRIYLLLLMGGIVAFSLTDNHFWERISTLTDRQVLEKDLATVNRREIWKVSLQVLADHPLGIGPGNSPTIIGTYDYRYWKRSTHNTIVVCFVELGIEGGLLFLSMVGGSIWCLYRSARLAGKSHNPVETSMIAYGFMISVVTYLVTGLGTERFYCESFWWVLVLPLSLYRIVLREVRESARGRIEPSEFDDAAELSVNPTSNHVSMAY